MKQYLIAHDLGTSGNKASLFSTDGELVDSCTIPYDVHFFGANCAEQDPQDWWDAICQATRQITKDIPKDAVLAMSFSSQMQACILVDKEGTLLRPAMIWADMRADQQAKQLEDAIGFERMYKICGHRVAASYSLEKLMWVRDHEPEIFDQTHCMLLAKDYIIYRLTGKMVTDYSEASGTNALDLKNLTWSSEILEAAKIPETLLPELHASTDVIGTLLPSAAKALDLSEKTAVVCGGGDGPCSALGAGCIEPNHMFLSYGTSAWIGGTTPEVFLDKKQVLFCFAHVIPGQYMPCGTMQAAGSSYSYIKNALCKQDESIAKQQGISIYDLLNSYIEKSPAGAKGLLFLPYMLGERSPRWNPDTSGSFLGIKMEHEKEDYLRAVLEGVAMNLSIILDSYKEQMEISQLILTGGGAKGDTLTHILADVLQTPLTRPDHVETATSIAAAMIAGVGIGIFKDFSEIEKFLTMKDTISPNPDNQAVYEKQKQLFNEAYECLLPLYRKM